jgi:hypothetical protein
MNNYKEASMKSYEMIDLHMHTVISDGTDSLPEIISNVRNAGISLFSVTDHDAIKAGKLIPPLLSADDPDFIAGVEFSCKDENGKYHILGYRYQPDSPAIQAVVDKGHSLRMKKLTGRLRLLKEEYGFGFTEDDIKKLLAMDNPGKPHIGNLMVKYGYARSKEQAIGEYIDKLHYRTEYVRPEEAISGILGAGGIPVLAHPIFGDGGQLILGEEMEERLLRLLEFGLQGVEGFYSGFTPKLIHVMLKLAEKYDLYVTAGSDYHGRNKLVQIGDTGLEYIPEEDRPEGLRRFLADIS